ncbi:GTPase family protein [Nitrincola alkalisediminis]|uniref:GTPase family protein n=1 Tax=Nitrincola alkalisediminis TaxID=1366656 RepID=UPI001873E86A|nr:GTPase [Nitrincola alkalisediminis]
MKPQPKPHASEHSSKTTTPTTRNIERLLSYLPWLASLFALPILGLSFVGLYHIWQAGWGLYFMGLVLLCSCLLALPLVYLRFANARSKAQLEHEPHTLDSGHWVSPQQDWSEFDLACWHALNRTLEDCLQQDASWGRLKEHAIVLLTESAQAYRGQHHRSITKITLLELLTLTEVVSRRYRHLLKEHLPYAEKIDIASLQLIYENRDRHQPILKLWNVWRVVRLATPSGWLAEARGQLYDYFFQEVKADLQHRLKQAFLQEVARVSIDLYSGRYQNDLEEASIADDQIPSPPEPSPLKIACVGQINAGKSTLINALCRELVTEVSPLPSTSSVNRYVCRLETVEALHLIDLPGLNGDARQLNETLDILMASDVILWVFKADQPARALDLQAYQAWQARYELSSNRTRKKPPVLGVLTQVDRLHLLQEWAPPYPHITSASPTAHEKWTHILDAQTYLQTLFPIKEMVCLALPENKPAFNLESLEILISEYYSEGLMTQLNRHRLTPLQTTRTKDEFKRAYRMGKSLFRQYVSPSNSPDKRK